MSDHHGLSQNNWLDMIHEQLASVKIIDLQIS